VPLILYIADLHLVAPSASVALGDHKSSLVSTSERVTHHDALKLTLQRLGEYLTSNSLNLEAVVVTGDVADKNNDGGYQAFEELIEALGSAKPPNSKIVVLPGNHDVSAGLKREDPRRYDKFIRFIRSAGYVTPWLSGIDKVPASQAEAEKYIVSLDDIQIIPIDTAEYSQVRLDVGISDASWKKLENALTRNPEELRNLERLRVVDAARVSEKQLETVRRILQFVTSAKQFPLRIAVMHHHLLPVSMREEIKPFESFTNLGVVRQFLMKQEITIVLHGHKHTAFSYIDYVSPYENSEKPPCAIRVVSGAAATAADLDRNDLFRLLDVQPEASLLKLSRIPAVMSGMELNVGKPEILPFERARGATVSGTEGCLVVEGDNVADVYPSLVAAVEKRGVNVAHVVCHVRNSPQLESLASLYPLKFPTTGAMDGETAPGIAAEKHLEQFRDIVDWWQYPSMSQGPLDQPAFTHGARIRRYEGHLDQVKAVINALSTDPQTSRGIIVLLNPPADRIDERDVPFPSFCLVQFKIGSAPNSMPSLECTAYFRKQEVRFWWLVNLAELSKLQHEICDALAAQKETQEIRNIQPGSITTIAARAHAGQSAPKVQVPQIDRYYVLERERLVNMVNSLLWKEMPNRERYADDWLRLFTELRPPENPDPDGLAVSLDGINYLIAEIDRHLNLGLPEREWLRKLSDTLKQLLTENQRFALLQQKANASSQEYGLWRNAVLALVTRIIELSYGSVVAATS
jgi:3',5'-cyclic AMP phosphodiesterase CpdA